MKFRSSAGAGKVLLLLFAGPLLSLSPLSGADSPGELARELREKRACEEMVRALAERLEYREELLQTGIAEKKIDPREEKRIRSSLEKLRKMGAKLKEKGVMTPGERKNIERELGNCYRLIWFFYRTEKIFAYSLYGKKYYLKEPWQTKYRKTTLSGKDMEEIMKVLEQLRRMRNNADKSADKESASLKKEIAGLGEKLLLEKYFTLEKPEEPAPEKAGKGRSDTKKKTTANKTKQPQTAKEKTSGRQQETPKNIKRNDENE
ncbi:MAG: hypothetical protein J6331_09570 [Lentisphaeria bacterium]|nr:hypothetical protein [Lentisphaeria bacterium]